MHFAYYLFPLLISFATLPTGQGFSEFPDVNPPVYIDPIASGERLESMSTIGGLLSRQYRYCVDRGYSLCAHGRGCCPIGGQCCRDDKCCEAGYRCIVVDDEVRCCPEWRCGYYTNPPVPTITIPELPTEPAEHSPSKTPSSSRAPSSSVAPTSSISVAPPPVNRPPPIRAPPNVIGRTNVWVVASNPDLDWSGLWTDAAPRCNTTGSAKKGLAGAELTFKFTGASAVYLHFWAEYVEYNVTIRNLDENKTLESTRLTAATGLCEYAWYKEDLDPTDRHEIKVVVIGPVFSSGRRAVGDLQFENLVLATPASSSSSGSTLPTGGSSGTGLNSATMLPAPFFTLLLLMIASLITL